QRAKLIQALRIAATIPPAVARHNTSACQPFFEAQRARMRVAVVTIGIVALNVMVFAFMVFGRGAIADPETLLRWGANFGPRTTNGEWWRLVTSTFIHAGLLPLVVNLVTLTQLGLVLERVVGRLTIIAVYMLAGMIAGLVGVAAHPVVVSAG